MDSPLGISARAQASLPLRSTSMHGMRGDTPILLSRSSDLAKAEAGGALVQREHEPIAQLLLALVLHQIQLVEAGVRRRQLLLAPVRLVDLELLRPADALRVKSTHDSESNPNH